MENTDRQTVLEQLQDWLEKPMLALSFVWLGLLAVELVWGLNRALSVLGQVIWALFVAEFAVSLTLAPDKRAYLRRNWLKALALAAPALRILRLARIARVARASRGLRLLRVVSSVNRGMNALGAAMRRRGFGYMLALTLLVTFAGAAAMYALEREAPGGGFDSYATALWWTHGLQRRIRPPVRHRPPHRRRIRDRR
jgi:voltage-gated potassium channel